ncbi:MAG TPA: hypothetical protein VGL65_01980 [Gemmatimonadales bacterium]
MKIAIAASIAAAWPLSGQRIAARWDVSIRGSAFEENGDMRFDGGSGRILLQHADSAFETMRDLHVASGSISFTLPGNRRFTGTITDTVIRGAVREGDGSVSSWTALPMPPGIRRWPVPPRVTVRQFATGNAARSERIPGAWLAHVVDTATLQREYRSLAMTAGVEPLATAALADGSRQLILGLDQRARNAARALIKQITAGPAADPLLQHWFSCPGAPCIDIHDYGIGESRHYLARFSLENAVRGLVALGDLVPGEDSAAIRGAIWRAWESARTDSIHFATQIDSLARRDELAANSVRALFAGYDDAVERWRGAVTWLLEARWLETPTGLRSPAQLMAAFWDVDSLPMPAIIPRLFGDVAANPVLGASHLAPFLLRPRNASATEWLAQGGVAAAFAAWRPLRWGEIPLVISIGGRAETVLSPAAQEDARPAAAIGPADAIMIDPGIMPIAAAAIVLHEWNHLVAEQRRVDGAHPPAIVESASQVELREADPWLGEGFAEWATDEVLQPAGASAALLRLTQAEKRLAIAVGNADDPHFLGYRLVRAAATGRTRALVRDQLVRHLDSPQAAAIALHLAGRAGTRPLILDRPANASVIPEISFTWDDGAVLDLTRRLIIPNSRLEH